jgi:hypothetical protein
MSPAFHPLLLLLGFCALALAPTAPAAQELASPAAHSQAIPALAWQLHQTEPSAEALLAQWQEAQDPRVFLAAAARGLRGQPALNALLVQALPEDGKQAAPAELLELLQAAPLDAACIPRLKHLQGHALWREAATLALLRAGEGAAALHGFPVLLESALQVGWRPSAAVCAEFFADPALRARLWPALVGEALSVEHASALRSIDSSDWPAGDRLLLDVLLVDTTAPSAESADILWRGWLNTPLPEAAGVALQDALSRHLPWADAEALRKVWQAAPEPRQKDGWALLTLLAPPPAAAMLRELALDEDQDSALRARAVNAVLRCGSDVDAQAVAALLHADTPQPILQSLFAGMRVRPASGIAVPLESMMPRLRTRLAGLAIELIVVNGSEDARLRWLDRLGALSQADQVRIVQAAWASAPSDALLDKFREYAASSEVGAALRGRVGLQAALSPQECADFYRSQFLAASSAEQRQAVLRSVRELRNDEALEVIVDWLETEEGRRHPSSASWAALMIEEPLAARAFRVWWQDRTNLSASQADAAASNLASESNSAREYLRKRIPLLETPHQVRMLSALIQAPQLEDAPLIFALFGNPSAEDPVRSRAAQIAGALAAQDEQLAERGWAVLLEASSQLPSPARDHRAFFRSWAQEAGDFEARGQLQGRLHDLPALWQQTLYLEWGLGLAAKPDVSTATTAAAVTLMNGLGAVHSAQDEDAQSAEALLRRERPILFATLAILGAQSSEQIDAELVRGFSELTTWHPDALAITTRSLESSCPQFFQAASERLRATEALDSWRRPPEAQNDFGLAIWTLQAAECFQALQDGLLDGTATPHALIESVAKRWSRDRRSHLWAGWYALRDASSKTARAAFERADACSGWLPYARMEPRLGLALCTWLEEGELEDLRALMASLPQVRDLLPHRVSAELIARLEIELGS